MGRHIFSLFISILLIRVGYAVVISPPVASEVKIKTEVDVEFLSTQQAYRNSALTPPTNHQENNDKQRKEIVRETPKRKSSLNKIHFSVWDTTDDQVNIIKT